MLIVKNTTETLQTWCGQEIAADDEYQIQANEQPKWADNETFLTALVAGEAVINDGYSDVTPGKAINLLKQIDIFVRDEESTPYFKQMFSQEDKKFQAKCFVFTTGEYGSLFNKNSEGTDLGEGEILFFDSSRTQLVKGETETPAEFQTRLDSNCKFTWLYFTSAVSFGISKGRFLYSGTISGEFHNWLEFAPHIPKAYGGSVACLEGGFPLDMMNQREFYEMDGCTCLIIPFDEVYYSHRIGHKIEHEIGDKLKICSIFDVYV
jgi:hypothetical protein